jgi:hypothetical protein
MIEQVSLPDQFFDCSRGEALGGTRAEGHRKRGCGGLADSAHVILVGESVQLLVVGGRPQDRWQCGGVAQVS